MFWLIRNPIFTLFGVYPESGILLASISPCGRYLITIGANGSYQIDFWLWTLGEERPAGLTFIKYFSLLLIY